MYRKIVAGVDERPHARDAAALGEALAEATDADLLLVAAYADPLLPFPLTVTRDPHRAAGARETLKGVRPALAPRARTRTMCDISPVRALRRCVRDEHADLLVLGSAAKGGAGLGTTGRALVRELSCAIAVAAPGLAERDDPGLREVVVGVDGRPPSVAALGVARALASGAGARLRIVAVVDDLLAPDTGPIDVLERLSEWDDVMARRAAGLQRRVSAVLDAGDPAPEVRVGAPAFELATAACDADLLVVGARQLTRFERLSLGSTSETLCQAAPCSILLVPAA